MGAWIETQLEQINLFDKESHPSWVRGLKQGEESENRHQHYVAPLVGAWIETLPDSQTETNPEVAPLVGAWIETNMPYHGSVIPTVAPLVGAWIETWTDTGVFVFLKSHPSWVRGLKLLLNES